MREEISLEIEELLNRTSKTRDPPLEPKGNPISLEIC